MAVALLIKSEGDSIQPSGVSSTEEVISNAFSLQWFLFSPEYENYLLMLIACITVGYGRGRILLVPSQI